MKIHRLGLIALWCMPILALMILPCCRGGKPTPALDEQLMAAARRDDPVRIAELLNKGVSAGAQDRAGGTALMEAAIFNSVAAAKLLVERGADVNARTTRGMTALAYATWPCKGAKLEQATAKNLTFAGKKVVAMARTVPRDKEMAELLIQKGADIDSRGEEGETPLFWAFRANNLELVRFFIEKGCDINARDKNGETVLILAARGENTVSEDFVAGKKSTASVEMMKLLVSKSADVDVKNNDGITALMETACTNSYEGTRLLVAKGADVNASEHSGATVLMFAVNGGSRQVVKDLIERGADVNAKTTKGSTALQIARTQGRKGIVELLKAHGATD